MLDAALYYGAKVESSSILQQLGLTAKQYALATLHRAENVDDKQRLTAILKGLKHYQHTIIWPLHPRTKKKLYDFGISIPENIKVIDPVGYLDMIMLEKQAALITTDSGGVQKEAYFHKVPCITMRDETEWIELVAQGANIITGADTEKIIAALDKSANIDTSVFDAPLYGEGNTGRQIVDTLVQYFN